MKSETCRERVGEGREGKNAIYEWLYAHGRTHTLTFTSIGASMRKFGSHPLSIPPTTRAILGAGFACRMSGLDAMTPESIESVAFSGGAVVRVANPRTSPPPCRV